MREKERLMSVSPPRNDLLDFPEEIMLNILSWLPVQSVLRCRRVCKTWRYLPILNNTYFADMHLRQHSRQFQRDYEYHHHHNNHYNFDSGAKASFVFLDVGNKLYHVEYDENDAQSYRTHERINLPLPIDIWSIVGSSNGLICLSVRPRTYVYDPVYICNPMTREIMHLPRFILNNKHKHSVMAYGFGHHPSTNEYKVVRIYYRQQPCIGQVQVYTLGSGSGWRNTGEINQTLLHSRPGVLLNGALHWLSREGHIVAFDLAEEEFCRLPTPPCFSPYWHLYSNILVLGGWLCIVNQRAFFCADIWLLKKKGKQNTSSDDDMKEQVYQPWSWSREFTIKINDIDLFYQPLAIAKSGGEILLLYDRKTIVCCDPKTTAEPKKCGWILIWIYLISKWYHTSTALFH